MDERKYHLLSEQILGTSTYKLTTEEFMQLTQLVGDSFKITVVKTENNILTIQERGFLQLAKYFNSEGKFIGEGKTADHKNDNEIMNMLPDRLLSEQPSDNVVNYELTPEEFVQLSQLAGDSFKILNVKTKNNLFAIQGKRSLLAKYFNSEGEFIGEGKTTGHKKANEPKNEQPIRLLDLINGSDQTSDTVNYEVTPGESVQLYKLIGDSFKTLDIKMKGDKVAIQGKRSLLAKYFNSEGEFIGEGKTTDHQNENKRWLNGLGEVSRVIFIQIGWLGFAFIYGLVQDTALRIVLMIGYLLIYLGIMLIPYVLEKFTSSVLSALPSDLSMGRHCLDSGQNELAANYFWRALDNDPGNAELWYLLGLAKDNNGQLDEALKHYERAISEQHDYPEAWNNKGVILTKKGNWTDAVECYKIAVEQGSEEAKNNLRTHR